MQLEAKKYLFDVQQAADLLATFSVGKSFADYEADALLRSAVERQFEIIGEALAQLARLNTDVAARISEYRRIIAFRNIFSFTATRTWITGWSGTSWRRGCRLSDARSRPYWRSSL